MPPPELSQQDSALTQVLSPVGPTRACWLPSLTLGHRNHPPRHPEHLNTWSWRGCAPSPGNRGRNMRSLGVGPVCISAALRSSGLHWEAPLWALTLTRDPERPGPPPAGGAARRAAGDTPAPAGAKAAQADVLDSWTCAPDTKAKWILSQLGRRPPSFPKH